MGEVKKNSAATRLRNYFLAGVLVTAPISITFWLTWRVITFIDETVTPIIPPRWNPETYLPFGTTSRKAAEDFDSTVSKTCLVQL